MKSLVGFLGIALVCGAALAAGALPVGTFEGTGFWQAVDGSSGQYKSRVVIADGSLTIEADYEREGKAHRERHTMTLAPKGPGFFELLDEKSQSVGQLACLDDQCSYNVRQEGLFVTESWRISGTRLQKFGSKEIDGFKIVWKETLFSN